MSEKLRLTGVGIKGLKYPINIPITDDSIQTTVATVNVFAIPPLGFTGPDIGNFTDILHRLGLNVDSESLTKVAEEVKRTFSSTWARVEASFVLFLKRKTPVTSSSSLSPYECLVSMDSRTIGSERVIQVKVPILTCYPFSSIPSGRIHSQKTVLTLRVRTKEDIPFDELIRMVESEASSPVYGYLSGADESNVIDTILSRPKTVLAVMQRVASGLEADGRISWYSLEADTMGSVHNYETYVFLEKDKWYLFPTPETIYQR